jgi:hypothetical protein
VATRYYIPENCKLHTRRRENLKSHTEQLSLLHLILSNSNANQLCSQMVRKVSVICGFLKIICSETIKLLMYYDNLVNIFPLTNYIYCHETSKTGCSYVTICLFLLRALFLHLLCLYLLIAVMQLPFGSFPFPPFHIFHCFV